MHKLFVLSHLRTLQRLGALEFTPAGWQEVASRNSLAPSGDGLLYRLPREELKHMLNIHCPLNSLDQPHAETIILAAKALRHHVKVDEEKHCAKCPFVEQCAHAKKPHAAGEEASSMRDLLSFLYGLQHLLRPETIYYRQWVSAYRLGDSILASIDDLSKGGKEIEEYDRLRIEGIKSFAERNALKQKEKEKEKAEGENADTAAQKEKEKAVDDKDFENVMKTVEAVAEEKPKPNKKKAANREKPQPRQPVEESLGRDFSFDEEAEFEPVQKFSKNSSEKPSKGSSQKGYQRIEQDEGRPGKAAYNKFRPEREPIEDLQEEFERYQPKGDNRKPYERYDKGDRQPRYDKMERNERYDRPDRGDRGESRGKQERGQWSNDREREFRAPKQDRSGWDNRPPKQDRYASENSRYSSDRRNDQNPRQSRQRDDDNPRIKQLNRNAFKERSRDFQEQSSPRPPAPKANPFVSKWKPEEEEAFEPRKAAPSRKTDFQPAAKPKIVEVETINESTEGSSEGRVGRRIRGRSGR